MAERSWNLIIILLILFGTWDLVIGISESARAPFWFRLVRVRVLNPKSCAKWQKVKVVVSLHSLKSFKPLYRFARSNRCSRTRFQRFERFERLQRLNARLVPARPG